jgi:hypothetical protein
MRIERTVDVWGDHVVFQAQPEEQIDVQAGTGGHLDTLVNVHDALQPIVLRDVGARFGQDLPQIKHQ